MLDQMLVFETCQLLVIEKLARLGLARSRETDCPNLTGQGQPIENRYCSH
ncbi:MAG: hypothetical protein H6Q00_1186 [Holophagaceae bacterium]|nr:hypothetical protein [Holophagaceae bacterium]